VALYAHGLRMCTCSRFSTDLCGMQCTLRMQWPLRKADMLAHTCRKREHFQVCTRTFWARGLQRRTEQHAHTRALLILSGTAKRTGSGWVW